MTRQNSQQLLPALILIVELTVGKALVSIPGLWQASVQRRRDLEFIPFHDFFLYDSPWIPLYYLIGNIVLFMPLGWALASGQFSGAPAGSPSSELDSRLHSVLVFSGLTSVIIEVLQYIFAVGYSDINDIWQNILGAYLGFRLYTWTMGRIFPVHAHSPAHAAAPADPDGPGRLARTPGRVQALQRTSTAIIWGLVGTVTVIYLVAR
ncbi:MAG: VanZ family protein [Corynebacterium sp.]|nr:VanZ family protein [Corynebacterium sp.]